MTTGSAELRDALKKYCVDLLGASGEFDVLPTIGSKEFVAWLPFLLRSEKVLIPKIAYPTYRVGGLLASADVIEVDIDAQSWGSELGLKPGAKLDGTLIWVNTPSNPTGRVHSRDEMAKALEFRGRGAVVAVDECYLPFADSKKPISTLQVAAGDNRNLLVVHSLSKRSNLAGYRGAFVAGDRELIARLLEVRKHAGMMVPAPIQHASAIALGDEEHVRQQAMRYAARRKKLMPALAAKGFVTEFSEAGLYIWCSDGRSDWQQVEWFAERGIIVTPGNFYGKDGALHIRMALTATDERIDEAISRILRD